MFNGRSFDADMRYWPVINSLERRYTQGESILEVGAGDYGLTPYLKVPITAVDIPAAFSEAKSDLVTPVLAHGVMLPFEDNSFDYVVSVDMLEHVSAKDRIVSISEMIRVAKRSVFITVPTGSDSERLDMYLHEAYIRRHGKEYLFLREHIDLKLPTAEQLAGIIGQHHNEVSEVWIYGNFSVWLRKYFMLLWMSPSSLAKKMTRAIIPLAHMHRLFSIGQCYRSVVIIDVS